MIKVQIYTNNDHDEYAICINGDQVMGAETVRGILYPHLEGEYEIEAQSDLACIDENIQKALALSMRWIDNCCEDGAEFECGMCLNPIAAGEMHLEIVLYAHDNEIGMVAAYHNDCEE